MKKKYPFLLILLAVSPMVKAQQIDLVDKVAQKMATGGCHRLRLDARGKNNYGTSPYPLDPSTEIARSSSTSSKPTQDAFDFVCTNYEKIDLQDLVRDIEDALEKAFVAPELRENVIVITTPSGTNAEMIISSLALARSKSGKVSALNVAADEVGSGMDHAATLRHFSKNVPMNYNKEVVVGELLEGVVPDSIDLAPFYLRERPSGKTIDMNLLETSLEERIDFDITQGKAVVLHIVHAAKTGIGGPRFEFAQRMKQKYGDQLIVKVDAAQGRFSNGYISKCLENKFIVLFTGSKFYGGVSFSGALFIPISEIEMIEKNQSAPVGFRDYFYDEEIEGEPNTGLDLRWQTALYEIKRYQAIDDEKICNQVIFDWVQAIKKIMRHYEWCTPLEVIDPATDFEGNAEFVGGVNTIRSFLIKKVDGIYFNGDDLKKVNQLLMRDLSADLRGHIDEEDEAVVSKVCYIGQPVSLAGGSLNVLRYCLSAPVVSSLIELFAEFPQGKAFEMVIKQDELFFRKLNLIVKNFDYLTK